MAGEGIRPEQVGDHLAGAGHHLHRLYGADEWALLEAVQASPDEPLDLADPFSVHFAS